MGRPHIGALAVLTAFLATACGERQIETPTAPDLASGSNTCNFTSSTGVVTLTKNEFGPSSSEATLATNMKNAGGGTAQATSIGFQILAAIGIKYDQPQTSTSNASALTVALLKCMTIGGTSVQAATFDLALGGEGAYAVVSSGDDGPVTSHDGQWVLELPAGANTWGDILPVGTNTILVYGVPVSNGSFTKDDPLTGIFDWSTLPQTSAEHPFQGVGVVVGNCNERGYLQHNAVGSGAEILGFVTPSCTSATGLLMEPAPRTLGERLLRLLSPAPAYASLVSGVTGATKKTLSPFQVEDITAVNLAATGFSWKKSGNTVGVPFSNVQTPAYQILSGGKTPFHQADVLVWLEAIGNNGVNVDICNNWAWTNANGVAQFPAGYLNKAGGYTITARTDGTNSNGDIPGVVAGNSVPSPLVNVKNGNPGTCNSFHPGDPLPDNPGPNGLQ